MTRGVLGTLVMTALLSAGAAAQTQPSYLDVYVVRVKPEKRADFDAVVKRMVDLNRRNSGDRWVTYETSYGEANVVGFSSLRRNYAEMQQGFEAFLGALGKTGGPAAAAKVMQDFNNCILSGRSEIRLRRMDLGSNQPADEAAMLKLVGQTRWLRTTIIRVRPGRLPEYEAQLRVIKAAREMAMPRTPTFVSQSVAGQTGTVLYASVLSPSLAGIEAVTSVPQLLGEAGYQKYSAVAREAVLSTEVVIYRYLPELSNPPEEVASVAPEFWRPKPVMVTRGKSSEKAQ